MGEQNLGEINLSGQMEHEKVMFSAGKKLGDFLERHKTQPEGIVQATERAMEYIVKGEIPQDETPDVDTLEVYGVMKTVADSVKKLGQDVDPKKLVEELLLNLPAKGTTPAKIAQQIPQAVKYVTDALAETEVKEAPKSIAAVPLIHGKPYSQELLEQATHKPVAAEIKPHGWSWTNTAVTVAVVGSALALASVAYGMTNIDTKGLLDKAGELVKLGQERGVLPAQNEASADKPRAKDLLKLYNQDPFNLYKEDGWRNLFNNTGVQEASTILVKYYGPNWWIKLLDKYPSTGNAQTDSLIEQHRQYALNAVATALKEKSVTDLQKYKNNPNLIWTRLMDLGYGKEIYTLYRVQNNPDKNDFQQFLDWQNGQYDKINTRPEQRDWKTPISFLETRPQLKARLSTAMFLGTFAAYPGLIDTVKELIGDRDVISVDEAKGILKNDNVKTKLTRRQFIKLVAWLAGSAVTRGIGL
ncbi:MAG: hypothetical protein M1120_02435 [Patescibacteria group bacterium]|nr:hypothetical protein [Patescibacteria group bacterium]